MPTATSAAPLTPLTGDSAVEKVPRLLPAFRGAIPTTHPLVGCDPHARPMGLAREPATRRAPASPKYATDERE